MEDKNKRFGYLVGQFIGAIFVGSLGVCISGILVALTIKFLMLIF